MNDRCRGSGLSAKGSCLPYSDNTTAHTWCPICGQGVPVYEGTTTIADHYTEDAERWLDDTVRDDG